MHRTKTRTLCDDTRLSRTQRIQISRFHALQPELRVRLCDVAPLTCPLNRAKGWAVMYEPNTRRPARAWAVSVSTVGNTENHTPIHEGITCTSNGISVVGNHRASCISCASSPTITSNTN